VHLASFHGSPGRHQRLTGDLTAEHSLALLFGADAAEDVDLDGLQVEEGDEGIEGGGHPVILPFPVAPTGGAVSATPIWAWFR
jgi:hypothetical protein